MEPNIRTQATALVSVKIMPPSLHEQYYSLHTLRLYSGVSILIVFRGEYYGLAISQPLGHYNWSNITETVCYTTQQRHFVAVVAIVVIVIVVTVIIIINISALWRSFSENLITLHLCKT
jgi:hypothetical protein